MRVLDIYTPASLVLSPLKMSCWKHVIFFLALAFVCSSATNCPKFDEYGNLTGIYSYITALRELSAKSHVCRARFGGDL